MDRYFLLGADLFVLYVDEFGNVFDKDWDEDGFYPREGWTNGTGAVGKIKADGWKINHPINGSIKESDYQKGPKGQGGS